MGLRDLLKTYAAANKSPVLAVPCPEFPQWDGQLFVCRISPRATASCWDLEEEDEADDERARFVSKVASDSDGSRIFQEEDVLWLSTTPIFSPLVERLYAAGRYHNGLTDENRMAWRKNSVGTVGSGSPASCAAPATPASASTTGAS